MQNLSSIYLRRPPAHALVVGASGGIGQTTARMLAQCPQVQTITCTSRSIERRFTHPKVRWMHLDLQDEASMQAVAKAHEDQPPLSLVMVASGVLHTENAFPERSFRQMEQAALTQLFAVNTVGPALIAKHMLPHVDKTQRSVFACLGARIGSIGDNRAGGWYAYRASKAALAMIIKTLSIELTRTHPKAIALALHPGTVRTGLSAPFVRPNSKRVTFSTEFSAQKLLEVIDGAKLEQSGQQLAYDGSLIEP